MYGRMDVPTDGWTLDIPPLMLLGRLGGVDLIKKILGRSTNGGGACLKFFIRAQQ